MNYKVAEVIDQFRGEPDVEFSNNSNPNEYFMRRKLWTEIMKSNSREWTLTINSAKIKVDEITDVIKSAQSAQEKNCPPEVLLEYH